MVTKPSQFKPKYIKKVDEYLKKTKDELYVFQKMSGKTDGFEEKMKVNLPTIEGFCMYIKVARRTVYEWINAHEDFKQSIEKINVAQKKVLIDKGLSGHYNPMIAKLILATNHGMKEKVDLTTDDKPIGGGFTDEQVDRIAERITSRKGTVSDTSGAK